MKLYLVYFRIRFRNDNGGERPASDGSGWPSVAHRAARADDGRECRFGLGLGRQRVCARHQVRSEEVYGLGFAPTAVIQNIRHGNDLIVEAVRWRSQKLEKSK